MTLSSPIAQSIQFICIFCTLSTSFQQTVYKRSMSAYVSSLSNWGFPTIPLHVLTLQKDLAGDFQRHFSILQRESQNNYYKEWCKICGFFYKESCKICGFFIFRCKARVGNCTLVSVWHPFEIIHKFVQPHHNCLSNIFHPKWSHIGDQNCLEFKSRGLCKNLDQLFQDKTVFFFTKISPARSSKEMSNTLWSLRLQTLITSTFVSNKICFDICSLHKHNHTINQILNTKRDVTTVRSHSFVSRAS